MNVVNVNHVVEASAILIPESSAERCGRSLLHWLPPCVTDAGDSQGVDPEALYLHRFADPWGDDTAANSRVHPRHLQVGFAGGNQPIVIHSNAVPRAGGVAFDDRHDCAVECTPIGRPDDLLAPFGFIEKGLDGDDVPERRVGPIEFGLVPAIRKPVGQHPLATRFAPRPTGSRARHRAGRWPGRCLAAR